MIKLKWNDHDEEEYGECSAVDDGFLFTIRKGRDEYVLHVAYEGLFLTFTRRLRKDCKLIAERLMEKKQDIKNLNTYIDR